MPAVFFVQVLAAFRAQALAILAAERLERDFEQSKITHQRLKVDVRIFGDEQTGIGDVIGRESVQLGKFPMQRLGVFIQAAHTFELGRARKISLHQQSLGSAANFNFPFHFGQRHAIFIGQPGEIKIEITVVAGSGIDEKTDIQPQGFTRIGHFVHFIGKIWENLCTF